MRALYRGVYVLFTSTETAVALRSDVRYLALVLFASCHHPAAYSATRYRTVEADVPAGISGLALDEHGHFWAIPERDPVVAEIVVTGERATIALHPLDGVPRELDTEAITYLGAGRFAIGVESHDRPYAGVYRGELRADGHIVVAPAYEFDSAALGIDLRANNGVESLCAAGAELIVGIESTGVTAAGERFAPIVRIDGATNAVQRLHLTTANGKLSSLACHPTGDGVVELLAIERDFGVSKILRVVSHPDDVDLVPTVVLDLWPLLRDRYQGRINLEGIVRLPDGRIVVVNDNQGPGLEGPTRLMFFDP